MSQGSTPSYITADLGKGLVDFSAPHVVDDAVSVTDVQAIASYSSVPSTQPRLIIPGSPPIWTGNVPDRIKPDSQTGAAKKKAACLGVLSSPVPIFVAVQALHEGAGKPKFDYKSLDIVADRNTLRKLLRWAKGSREHNVSFRVDIQRAGNTCIFIMCTEGPQERAKQSTMGYGFGFEQKTTCAAPGCEQAAEYARIIAYKLGGLNILLRFEVDACIQTQTEPQTTQGDLTTKLSGLTLNSSSAQVKGAAKPSTAFGLSVELQPSQELVPQTSLVELVTRSVQYDVGWGELFPQLYLSQTEHVFIAKHSRGVFRGIPVSKMRLSDPEDGDMVARKAEADHTYLPRLKAMLDDILREVRGVEEGAMLSLVRDGGNLTLYRRTGGTGTRIPEVFLNKFRV